MEIFSFSIIIPINISKYSEIFSGWGGGGNPIYFYIAHTSNKLDFNQTVQNYYFNVITENTIYNIQKKINNCFQEMEKNKKKLVLINDWSNANVNYCQDFLLFLERLIKVSRDSSPANWKRKYSVAATKNKFLLINAIETGNIPEDFLQQLIYLHDQVFLLQENQHIFQLPAISHSIETIVPQFQILPQKQLEKIVKDNLELVTLLFLENKNKSGFQILKEIAQQFHCILSQGTLYPLLYQLEKENIIQKQTGKGREIIYSLTEETKEGLSLKKETSFKICQHWANFLKGGGGV